MSGMVERLRGTYSTGPFGKRDFAPYIPAIQTEAAARIEELEAALRFYGSEWKTAAFHMTPTQKLLDDEGYIARQVLGKQ